VEKWQADEGFQKKSEKKFGWNGGLAFIFATVLIYHLSRKAEGYGPLKP
jgi:hypothetical protein